MNKKNKKVTVIVVTILVIAMAVPSFSMLFYALR